MTILLDEQNKGYKSQNLTVTISEVWCRQTPYILASWTSQTVIYPFSEPLIISQVCVDISKHVI